MTAEEYKAALHSLNLSQVGAGEFFEVHGVTARRWASKGPPTPVAKMLRLMVALQFSPQYVERVCSLVAPPSEPALDKGPLPPA